MGCNLCPPLKHCHVSGFYLLTVLQAHEHAFIPLKTPASSQHLAFLQFFFPVAQPTCAWLTLTCPSAHSWISTSTGEQSLTPKSRSGARVKRFPCTLNHSCVKRLAVCNSVPVCGGFDSGPPRKVELCLFFLQVLFLLTSRHRAF